MDDIERLSAYIDDALPPEERQALELQLSQDPDLRRTLEEMRETVHLLHELPPMKAPRNFTLTSRAFDWWGVRLAGALGAAASLVIVLGVLLMLSGGAPEAAPVAAAPTLTAAPVDEVQLELQEESAADKSAPAPTATLPAPAEAPLLDMAEEEPPPPQPSGEGAMEAPPGYGVGGDGQLSPPAAAESEALSESGEDAVDVEQSGRGMEAELSPSPAFTATPVPSSTHTPTVAPAPIRRTPTAGRSLVVLGALLLGLAAAVGIAARRRR